MAPKKQIKSHKSDNESVSSKSNSEHDVPVTKSIKKIIKPKVTKTKKIKKDDTDDESVDNTVKEIVSDTVKDTVKDTVEKNTYLQKQTKDTDKWDCDEDTFVMSKDTDNIKMLETEPVINKSNVGFKDTYRETNTSIINFKYHDALNITKPANELTIDELLMKTIALAHRQHKFPLCNTLKQVFKALHGECYYPGTKFEHSYDIKNTDDNVVAGSLHDDDKTKSTLIPKYTYSRGGRGGHSGFGSNFRGRGGIDSNFRGRGGRGRGQGMVDPRVKSDQTIRDF